MIRIGNTALNVPDIPKLPD